MNKRLISCFVLLQMAAITLSQGQAENLAVFEVHSGAYHRNNVPVHADISGISPQNEFGSLQIVEITNTKARLISSQIEVLPQLEMIWWILDGETPPETSRIFALRRLPTTTGSNRIKLIDNQEAIDFLVTNKPVLSYHYARTPVPAGVSELYRRGGYIHPLHAPSGDVVTRIQPPDHYHHYGVWNPWTHTEFEGKEIDFWNLHKGQATIEVMNIPSVTSGDIFGSLRAIHEHIVKSDSTHSEDRVALNEQWELRVWGTKVQQGAWIVDLSSTLSCATESPLIIKKYRYQGFGFRGIKEWDDETVNLLTSEGHDKSNANATRARWCDISGPTESGTSGITFMTHPTNFNFPEHLRIWPIGSNQGKENVFLNYNPAQDRDWKLRPGVTYTLKYRMIVYDGRMSSDQANKYWNDYAHPPVVTRGTN